MKLKNILKYCLCHCNFRYRILASTFNIWQLSVFHNFYSFSIYHFQLTILQNTLLQNTVKKPRAESLPKLGQLPLFPATINNAAETGSKKAGDMN